MHFPDNREVYDGAVHVPPKVRSPHPRRIEGMATRTSTRWFQVKESKKIFTPVPYVTNSGKFSISTLCFWNTYPEQIIASLTSTVYQRLRGLVGKRHGFRCLKHYRETLFKIAAYYTVTHDDYFMDRVLGILKRKARKQAHNLLHFAVSTMDENIRFVYDQICSQILWLSFRAKTVVFKRDKSKCSDSDADFLDTRSYEAGPRCVDWLTYKRASRTWELVHSYRCSSINSPDSTSSGSEFDDYLSETCTENLEW